MKRGVSIVEARIAGSADGWRLDRALADALPEMSRERLKALIGAGQISGTGGPVRDASKKVAAGSLFIVEIPDPTPLHNEAQDIALNVVFEDEHLIVIDKPAGLVVHPAAGNLDGTLVNALLHHCAGSLSGIGGVARPGIVHRIDKDTSGLMVAAKTDAAHLGLAAQFKEHSIDRRYKAIAAWRTQTEGGTVNAPLGRSPTNRKKMAIAREGSGKHAVTHWRKLRQLRDATFIECRLETGRTHQVRVHMSSIGHPLLGDPVYGSVKQAQRELLATLGFRRQALHAAHLGFIHPVKSNALAFDSEMPADMQELFNKLIV
ncbi:RluA family pseudouridine synthase [Sphingomonas sp. M1-B02]|uniref:RluA family pseudouridine synthase n=1 Tax=Sphingomonas sp. M1-B02 TaxID=3114300 RepID=UPI00223FA91B|nr:RluA family pseudouridine synthase [Sphingomonas sp. S6-11]UZK66516.1 RluA family pseudouridine synthase [Sphingomonas sp. S6-11]